MGKFLLLRLYGMLIPAKKKILRMSTKIKITTHVMRKAASERCQMRETRARTSRNTVTEKSEKCRPSLIETAA